LLFAGTRLAECVVSQPGARVLQVRPDGEGGVSEVELPVRLLPGPESRESEDEEQDDISELRALRSGRHRWD
jgi:hypothetical protein